MADIPRPIKFSRDIQDIGTGWVVRNLCEYGNSVLPTSLLEIMSEKTLSRLLTVIIDDEIRIRETQFGYIAERV